MIVEMKKVSLVILEAEKKESLKALRKAGVIHLEEVEGSARDGLPKVKSVSDGRIYFQHQLACE